MSSYEGRYQARKRASIWERVLGCDTPAAFVLNSLRLDESRFASNTHPHEVRRMPTRSPSQENPEVKMLQIRGLEVIGKPEGEPKKPPEISISSRHFGNPHLIKIRSLVKEKPISLLQTLSSDKEAWLFKNKLDKRRTVVPDQKPPSDPSTTHTKISPYERATTEKPALSKTVSNE